MMKGQEFFDESIRPAGMGREGRGTGDRTGSVNMQLRPTNLPRSAVELTLKEGEVVS